ncbi:MAG: hypothetical protein Q9168_000655 [Polycauliona sp. 1 TL-2023]
MSLTPGNPTQWSGILFVRKGPYAPAILRFHLAFPPGYPDLPPLITFTTDIFHPLVTPVTTYTNGARTSDSGAHGAGDEQRLPPGGYALTDAFPRWFVGSERSTASAIISPTDGVAQAEPSEHGEMPHTNLEVQLFRISIVHVLNYVKSSFDDSDVLDRLPSAGAVNPGAWKAWQAYRCGIDSTSSDATNVARDKHESHASEAQARHPDNWSWEGVWERRVRKGVDASISDPVLFGASGGGETINKRKRQPSQHSATGRTSLSIGGLVPAAKVRRAATMSYPPTFLSTQSTWDHDNFTGPSRAVTLGSIDSLRQRAPRDSTPIASKLSKTSIKGRPRSQPNRKSSPDSHSDHTVRRPPSFRHRILSRVMNSLIGRSSSTPSVADNSDQRYPPIQGSTSSESAGSAAPESTSLSTAERSSSIGTNLETALSEFPEPPLTTPVTLRPFAPAQFSSLAHRKLHAPTDVAILGPEILITPELDSLDSDKDQRLYVAVEISAVAEVGSKTQDDRFYGLDVAVIIDNSYVQPLTGKDTPVDNTLQTFCISSHADGEL